MKILQLFGKKLSELLPTNDNITAVHGKCVTYAISHVQPLYVFADPILKKLNQQQAKEVDNDNDNEEKIAKLLREKEELLVNKSIWPWNKEANKKHKEINSKLEALGVYQGKTNRI